MGSGFSRNQLKREIDADDRRHAASEPGIAEREQHAARQQQVARDVHLDARSAEQQRQISRPGNELIE